MERKRQVSSSQETPIHGISIDSVDSPFGKRKERSEVQISTDYLNFGQTKNEPRTPVSATSKRQNFIALQQKQAELIKKFVIMKT